MEEIETEITEKVLNDIYLLLIKDGFDEDQDLVFLSQILTRNYFYISDFVLKNKILKVVNPILIRSNNAIQVFIDRDFIKVLGKDISNPNLTNNILDCLVIFFISIFYLFFIFYILFFILFFLCFIFCFYFLFFKIVLSKLEKTVGILLYNDIHTIILDKLEKGERSEKMFYVLLNTTSYSNYLPQSFYCRMDLIVKIAKKSNTGFERYMCAGNLKYWATLNFFIFI